MPLARYELAAGVSGGKIYAIGGFNDVDAGGNLTANEAYDPFVNSWSPHPNQAYMPTGRHAMGSVSFNGRVYVIGGLGAAGFTSAVESYDGITNAWSTGASMHTPRFALGTAVSNGLIYALGGRGNAGRVNTLEVYNPTTNTWLTKNGMPTARESMGVVWANGMLYAIGGNSGLPFPNPTVTGVMEAYRP